MYKIITSSTHTFDAFKIILILRDVFWQGREGRRDWSSKCCCSVLHIPLVPPFPPFLLASIISPAVLLWMRVVRERREQLVGAFPHLLYNSSHLSTLFHPICDCFCSALCPKWGDWYHIESIKDSNRIGHRLVHNRPLPPPFPSIVTITSLNDWVGSLNPSLPSPLPPS